MGERRPALHDRPVRLTETERDRIRRIVALALEEDLGPGDATSRCTVPEGARASARVFAKEDGVVSGLEAAREVVRQVDPGMELIPEKRDGDPVANGETVLVLNGSARSLLSAERTLLNFLQQLSGVATLTRRYMRALEGTSVRVVDTRKTTPGLRILEKAAVRDGGGGNHRIGLFDAFMVKDNHIVAAGGMTAAVERIRADGPDLYLVVEARTQEEVAEAARLDVDQLLLDNMTPEQIVASIQLVREIEAGTGRGPVRIEVSGGVTLETVREKAIHGVDVISVGALTHSARALDLSMDLLLHETGVEPR